MQKINTVKGTKDIFGQTVLNHEYVIEIFKNICDFFSLQKIYTPILEQQSVFTKTLGLSSDIISKEMYSFTDQGGDNLVLRPEGTAAIVRALISNSFQDLSNKNFYYHGPMFRRERPQSGRLRQFHQVGIELFNSKNFIEDVKSIILAEKFLSFLGIRNKLELQINSLGDSKSREKFLIELKRFLKANYSSLSDESKKRLETNPLRILDSKEEKDKKLLKKSPQLTEFLDDESKFFFDKVVGSLEMLNIKFTLNPFLVRGLDYYNHTAFEYITSDDKSQNTVLAGGRYDGLVKSLGGKDIDGVGWAAGVERILMILKPTIFEKRIISIFSTSSELDSTLLFVYSKIKVNEKFSLQLIYGNNFKKK